MASEYVLGEGVRYSDDKKEVKKEASKEETKPTGEEAPAERKETKAEPNAHEVRARASGWKPKEEWEGDPDEWRGAREYNDRGELLNKIKSTSAELRAVQQSVQALAEHNKSVYVAGYEKALADLKLQRAQAIENNDGKALLQIEDAMDKTKEAIVTAKQAPTPQAPKQLTAEFERFVKDNAWYNTDETLQAFSHGVAINFGKKNPNASERDVYEHIEKAVKDAFPDKFNKRSIPPPALDGEGRASTAGRAASKGTGTAKFEELMSKLPEDQARVARDLVKRKFLTAEKYVEDYESIAQGR